MGVRRNVDFTLDCFLNLHLLTDDHRPVVDRRLLTFLLRQKGKPKRVEALLQQGVDSTAPLACGLDAGSAKRALRNPANIPLKGGPFAASQKMGRLENSPSALPEEHALASACRYAGVVHAPRNPCYTSNIDPSFSIFCLASKAATHRNCKGQKQRQLQRHSAANYIPRGSRF
ncbi:hypothetical protein [Undibacterium sp. TS12]|uniref:hypothetical protein n=1 Tax=Undibacterium sp. TS12 TaxID=2908202 RepID=UPI001F4D0568|nr:hypothetical protein [Undibacterium sp. TS12]MCH8619476.1 hypothetical protein [Undibacterium sp. TS12]